MLPCSVDFTRRERDERRRRRDRLPSRQSKKKKECVKEATGALRIDPITCADKRVLLQIIPKKSVHLQTSNI